MDLSDEQLALVCSVRDEAYRAGLEAAAKAICQRCADGMPQDIFKKTPCHRDLYGHLVLCAAHAIRALIPARIGHEVSNGE